MACAKLCHEHGMKVLLNDSPFTSALPRELVDACDILLVNEHEMAQLLGMEAPEEIERTDWEHVRDAMHAFGFDQAIVTLGRTGIRRV